MNPDELLKIANAPAPKSKLFKLPSFTPPEFKAATNKQLVFRLCAIGAAVIAGVHGYESLRCYEVFNVIESNVGLAPAVSALMLSTRFAHGLNFWRVTKPEFVAALLSMLSAAGWLSLFNAGGSLGAGWFSTVSNFIGDYPAIAVFAGLQALLLVPAIKGIAAFADSLGDLAMQLLGIQSKDSKPESIAAAVPEPKKIVYSNTDNQLREWLDDNGYEEIEIVAIHEGHTLVTYELALPRGVKVKELLSCEKDISRELRGQVRIVPVTQGKNTVSVEVPKLEREFCQFDDILKSKEYKKMVDVGGLPVVVGADKYGKPLVLDLRKMPHLLIAGATGTGKSVGLNSVICGLAALSPERVRFVMTDPKYLELNLYNELPHMLKPCMYELEEVEPVLSVLVNQMNKRLKTMAKARVRNIDEYNAKCKAAGVKGLPAIVCVIDEFAEMMLEAMKEKDSTFQDSVQSLAQKARAAGIHLILATQKPVVKVLDGVIKANIPARIAFQVSSGKDSEVVLDQRGAEQLIGNGDCLVGLPDRHDLVRAQGAFISTEQAESFVAKYAKD